LGYDNPSAFLIAIDRFHGGIDVDVNVAIALM
jgi:hypothetical protein